MKVSSKWFAYGAMMFLEDHYKPRGTRNTSEVTFMYIYVHINVHLYFIS